MKLLRLKITDPAGFRSLQAGFEYHFRTPWELQDEQGFAPFVLAGPNGSGKSNLLEVLAAIFYQLEVSRVRRSFLPATGFENDQGSPDGFELEYLIRLPEESGIPSSAPQAHVQVVKELEHSPTITWLNRGEFGSDHLASISEDERDWLLPQHVVGYSSGENQILSLPFFKMRFVQFDEYWDALKNQFPYPGKPETRLAYLDSSFSQAILLCSLLFQDADASNPFLEDIGIEALKEFRIIIRRSIPLSSVQADDFKLSNNGQNHPAVIKDPDTNTFSLNLMKLLEADAYSAPKFDPIVTRLKRCATCSFVDENTDTLYLDYYVNDATRNAFRDNFERSPIVLFQAFQVLLALNLYSVSETLKSDLYRSDSHYVSETVPILASDERIMRFKFVKFSKEGVAQPAMLKSLSDGEHQLLHSLGLCLLFKQTTCLFLLDEPETHFNPDWRANFATRVRECFAGSEDKHEVLITTHTPFLISDSKPDKVLVFSKENGQVTITKPDYNTLGASINKITMNTFKKRETIGRHAQSILEELRSRFEQGEDGQQIVAELNQQLGDSVEKVLLIKTILDRAEGAA